MTFQKSLSLLLFFFRRPGLLPRRNDLSPNLALAPEVYAPITSVTNNCSDNAGCPTRGTRVRVLDFLPSSPRTSAHLSASALSSLLLLLVAIPFLASCGQKSSAAASTANLFPEATAVQGWSRSAEIRTYPAAELSNYIDGDVEKYIKAGVQSTSTADYKFQNKFDSVADIKLFNDATGPKSIFASEPAAEAATPPLGEAARLFEQSLLFRKGRYLVRIVAYQASPQMQQGLLDLGKSIEQKLSK